MITRYTVHVTYTFECSACGNVAEQSQKVTHQTSIPTTILPDGWLAVNNMVFCPNHNLKFTCSRINAEDLTLPITRE